MMKVRIIGGPEAHSYTVFDAETGLTLPCTGFTLEVDIVRGTVHCCMTVVADSVAVRTAAIVTELHS